MRISYLHYALPTDMAMQHVRQFAAACTELGHEVAVHAMNLAPSGPRESPATSSASLRQIAKRRFGRYLHEPKEILWNFRYVPLETARVRRDHPDVLLVRNHFLTASCVAVAARLRLPLVLEVNAPPEESRLYFDHYAHVPLLPDWLETWKLRAADAITTVSTPLKNHLVDRYRLDSEKVHVVANGADTDMFQPRDAPRGAAGSPVIGFVGSFQKWHGVGLFADMVERLEPSLPDARYVLVGTGPELPRLRKRLERFGDRVTFTDVVAHDRIPTLVSSLDVAVLPESDFYRCPLKVLEWMAAGRAIVAPRYAPLEELIEDSVSGVLFPPGDLAALCLAVASLATDASRRQQLGSAAARRVRSTFTWAHNAERVVEVATSALSQRSTLATGIV